MQVLSVHITVHGISSADEDSLEHLNEKLEGLGAEGVAVVYYPEENEIGMLFDIEEDALGRLLQPVTSRAAA